MPRPKPATPKLYQHKSGQARVRIAGKDVYLGVYGSAEAARAYADLLDVLARGQQPDKKRRTGQRADRSDLSAVTVAVVVARWFAEESPRYPANGRETKQFEFTVPPLLRLYSTLPANEFDCDKLERVQLAMASGSWLNEKERARCKARGKPLGWSRGVVNRRVVRIRTIFRWAERKRLVPPGTFAHLCTLPGLAPTDARVRHTTQSKSATMQEVNAICKYLSPVGRAMLLTQWWTGMRSGEVRLMRENEVDRTGEVWVYTPATHKMQRKGQSRAILIGGRAQAALRWWLLAAEPGAYVFPPSKTYAGKQGCYSDTAYARLIARAAEVAGVAGFHPYRCRHAAKNRITSSMGLDAARTILGQRSLGTTNQYGDALDLRTAMEVARKLG